jgi:hypothetical protein
MAAEKKLPYPPPAAPKTRPLVLRRDEWGQVALFDAETGDMIAAQAEVQIRQQPSNVTEVTVTFYSHPGDKGLHIQIND